MIKTYRNILAIALLGSLHAASFAGSPGGLRIIAVPTSKALAYEGRIKGFFKQYDQSSTQGVCDDAQLSVGSVQYNSGTTGITGDFAKKAATLPKQRKKLNHMLTTYRDKTYPRGFDLALVYDVVGEKMVFQGISGFAKQKVNSSSVALTDIEDNSKVALAICRAAAHAPVLESGD